MFLILRVNLYFSEGHSAHDSPFIWRNQNLEYFNYCLGDRLFCLFSVSNVSPQLSKLDGVMRCRRTQLHRFIHLPLVPDVCFYLLKQEHRSIIFRKYNGLKNMLFYFSGLKVD